MRLDATPPARRWTARAAWLSTVLALGACGEGFDFRSPDLTGGAVTRRPTENRPPADARGVISYPEYQVAVARQGDTPAAVAARVGLQPSELASYNGLPETVALRGGEVLALPRRVSGGAADQAGSGGIAALAGAAIERSAPTQAAAAAQAPAGRQPVRHEVARGETAYTIARTYDISVRALAEWNGLGPDLLVREGQIVLIPPVQAARAPGSVVSTPIRSAAVVDTALPGAGSRTPVPPSAAAPLPEETTPEPTPEVIQTAEAATPDLSEEVTEASASGAGLRAPVSGPVIRAFEAGSNDGVDFAVPAGTEVRAAAGGSVAAITQDTDGVPILVLRHDDNLLTVYAGIEDLTVAKGDRVEPGAAVAKVRSGGALHFEVREGFEAVDPEGYLN